MCTDFFQLGFMVAPSLNKPCPIADSRFSQANFHPYSMHLAAIVSIAPSLESIEIYIYAEWNENRANLAE